MCVRGADPRSPRGPRLCCLDRSPERCSRSRAIPYGTSPVSKSWPRAVVPFPDSQPPTGVIRRTSFWRCPLYYNWERVFCRGVGLWLAWLGFVNQIESGVRLECSMTKDQPLILPSVGRVQGQGTWQKTCHTLHVVDVHIYIYICIISDLKQKESR